MRSEKRLPFVERILIKDNKNQTWRISLKVVEEIFSALCRPGHPFCESGDHRVARGAPSLGIVINRCVVAEDENRVARVGDAANVVALAASPEIP